MDRERSFEIRTDEQGTVWLCGEVDLAGADSMLDELSESLDGRPPVIDVSELTFIDSSGIRALLQFATRTQRAIVLRRPSDHLRKILTIAGVDGRMGVRLDPP